jgi:hypothetical protein
MALPVAVPQDREIAVVVEDILLTVIMEAAVVAPVQQAREIVIPPAHMQVEQEQDHLSLVFLKLTPVEEVAATILLIAIRLLWVWEEQAVVATVVLVIVFYLLRAQLTQVGEVEEVDIITSHLL